MESPTTKTTRPSHPPKPAKAVSGGSNGLFPRAVSQPVATATQNSPIPRLSTAPPNHTPSRGTGPLCQSPGRIRTPTSTPDSHRRPPGLRTSQHFVLLGPCFWTRRNGTRTDAAHSPMRCHTRLEPPQRRSGRSTRVLAAAEGPGSGRAGIGQVRHARHVEVTRETGQGD